MSTVPSRTRVVWVPQLADPAAPTQEDLARGVDLTEEFSDFDWAAELLKKAPTGLIIQVQVEP